MFPSAVDTLSCDTAQLHAWQSDATCDYQRELVAWQPSLWDWFTAQLNDILSDILGSKAANAIGTPLLVGLGAAFLLFVVWFVYRTRPELFLRNRRKTVEEPEVETIYGVDFDAVIRQAVANGDYRQAVRNVYLQTLRALSDQSLIDWMPYKTPSQYVREYGSDEFRQLTNYFLRVRYGNFEATPSTYDSVCRLQSSVIPKEERP